MAVDPSAFSRSAFDSLPGPALQRLANSARKACFARGERIAPLVNPPKRVVVLLTGVAKLTGTTLNGHERIIYVFRPGELIGSRVFLERSVEASYEVVAMTRVEGVSVELSDFFAAGEEHPEIILAATNAFSRRLGRVTNHLMAATTQDASFRLCHLLLDFVRADSLQSVELVPLDYPLTHETMANIIGASRPHTSSVLAMLESKGVVCRMRRSLLVNPIELQRYLQADANAEGARLSAATPRVNANLTCDERGGRGSSGYIIETEDRMRSFVTTLGVGLLLASVAIGGGRGGEGPIDPLPTPTISSESPEEKASRFSHKAKL